MKAKGKNNTHTEEILENIVENDFEIKNQNLSQATQDLIRGIIITDHKKRFKIKEIYAQQAIIDWMKTNELNLSKAPHKSNKESVISNIKQKSKENSQHMMKGAIDRDSKSPNLLDKVLMKLEHKNSQVNKKEMKRVDHEDIFKYSETFGNELKKDDFYSQELRSTEERESSY